MDEQRLIHKVKDLEMTRYRRQYISEVTAVCGAVYKPRNFPDTDPKFFEVFKHCPICFPDFAIAA